MCGGGISKNQQYAKIVKKDHVSSLTTNYLLAEKSRHTRLDDMTIDTRLMLVHSGTLAAWKKVVKGSETFMYIRKMALLINSQLFINGIVR